MTTKYDQQPTVETILGYQRDHLAQHKLLLKPEVYAELEKRVLATNADVKEWDDVCRGGGIDNILIQITQEMKYRGLTLASQSENALPELLHVTQCVLNRLESGNVTEDTCSQMASLLRAALQKAGVKL